ncbi:hypothetical protein [Paenibacillus sp. FSL H7-0323]|jgi:Arc/MetJ-type ribon-helix-helix transcriptional regulator|uniref:hypothetical protein n=1 Tax=Paenibacillus sp. FSL H7-0323 TaxID=2921433 RepID=UPI0030FC3545
MNDPITFRLRKDLDADIKEAVKDMDKKTVSSLSRDGLRLMLGIKTTKSSTVTERPLVVPDRPLIVPDRALPWITADTRSKPVVSKPAVYIPNRR